MHRVYNPASSFRGTGLYNTYNRCNIKSRDAKGLKCYVFFCDGLYWSTTLWFIIVLSPHKEGINYKCCMQQGHALTKCRIFHFSQLKIFSPVVQVLYSRLFASLTWHLSIENFGHILAEQINPAKIFYQKVFLAARAAQYVVMYGVS